MHKVAGVVLMIGMSCMSALGASPEAPQYAPLEVSFSYSYARANAGPGQCGCFNMNGGSTEVAFHAYRGLSAVVDFTGERAGSIGLTPGAGLSLVSVTVGPRYSFRFSDGKLSRYTPFVQGLVGRAHGFDSLFPNANGSAAGAANALTEYGGRRARPDHEPARRHPRHPGRLPAHATAQCCRQPAELAARQCRHRLPRLVGLVRRFISLCCYWLQRPPPDPPGSASGQGSCWREHSRKGDRAAVEDEAGWAETHPFVSVQCQPVD